MALSIRNAAVVYREAHVAAAVPFAALPTSTLVLAIFARGANNLPFGAPSTPAGWTLRETHAEGNAYGIFTAPGTTLAVPASGQLGGVLQSLAVLELAGAVNLDRVTGGHTGGQGWGPPTTAGPAVPHALAVGAEAMAVAVCIGMTGDPSAGCFWNARAGWTREACSTHSTEGYSPWWAVYSRRYEAAPASVSDTFTNTIGQSTAGGVVIVPAAPAGGAGFAPRFW